MQVPGLRLRLQDGGLTPTSRALRTSTAMHLPRGGLVSGCFSRLSKVPQAHGAPPRLRTP